MLDKLPGLWYIDHRPGNYNYKEDKLCAFGLMMYFIGCEIDDGYFEIAKERLTND